MSFPLRVPAVVLAAFLLTSTAACSSSKKASSVKSSNAPTTTTAAGSASTGGPATTVGGSSTSSSSASGAGSAASGSAVPVATPDGNKYSVKVTVAAANAATKPPCAVTAQSGRQTVGFTMVITNQSGKDAPSPPIGLLVDDPQKIGSELAAMTVDNSCIDFLLTGDTIKAGESVTYNGSVSNATTAAKLVVNMKAGTIADGRTQEAFALFK